MMCITLRLRKPESLPVIFLVCNHSNGIFCKQILPSMKQSRNQQKLRAKIKIVANNSPDKYKHTWKKFT